MSSQVLYEFDKFRLDPVEGVLIAPHGTFVLDPLACEVLRTFLNHPNHILSFDFLIREAWGNDDHGATSNEAVSFQIHRLRKVLQDDASRPRFIETLRKKGFRFLRTVRRMGRSGQAAELFERGRYFYHKSTPSDIGKAIDCFRRLIALNSDYLPDAYAGIAESYVLLGTFAHQTTPAFEAMEHARASASRALAIDPENAEAHAALGSVSALYDWNWETASRHFRKALDLSCNPLAKPLVRSWYALCLAARGNAVQAREEIGRARADFPSSFLIPALAGRIAYLTRDMETAIQQCDEAIALEEHFYLSYVFKGHALRVLREYDEALECFQRATALTHGNPVCMAEVAQVEALKGNSDASLEILRCLTERAGTQYLSPHTFAVIHLALGEKAEALRHLDFTLQERGAYLIFLTTDPLYEALRIEPEFSKLIAAVGFATQHPAVRATAPQR